MQAISWGDVLRRNFVGGHALSYESASMSRGEIERVSLDGDLVVIPLKWRERFNHLTGNWERIGEPPVFRVSIEHSRASVDSRGVIHYSVMYIGSFELYPPGVLDLNA